MGEDARVKLWEEELGARADGTVALVPGRPMVVVFSNPLAQHGWLPLKPKQVLSKLSSEAPFGAK